MTWRGTLRFYVWESSSWMWKRRQRTITPKSCSTLWALGCLQNKRMLPLRHIPKGSESTWNTNLLYKLQANLLPHNLPSKVPAPKQILLVKFCGRGHLVTTNMRSTPTHAFNWCGWGYPATLRMRENTNVYVYFIISVKAHGCNLDVLKSEHVHHLAIPVWWS